MTHFRCLLFSVALISLSLKSVDSFRINLNNENSKKETIDATKDDIINALMTTLTSMMNKEDYSSLEKDYETNEVWPIFAQGGEYGPRYDVFDDSDKRSEAAEAVVYIEDPLLSLTKKDLESMLHQPDPALTVQELPKNPQISFRKGYPPKGGQHEDSAASHEMEVTTETPSLSLSQRGMKEEPMFRPMTSASQSPFLAFIEAQQLRSLAEAKKHPPPQH